MAFETHHQHVLWHDGNEDTEAVNLEYLKKFGKRPRPASGSTSDLIEQTAHPSIYDAERAGGGKHQPGVQQLPPQVRGQPQVANAVHDDQGRMGLPIRAPKQKERPIYRDTPASISPPFLDNPEPMGTYKAQAAGEKPTRKPSGWPVWSRER